MISTKYHGIVSKSTPFIEQFNHLNCNLKLDGKDILLDASKGVRPTDLLPENDLNRYGFLLHKDNSRWIDIPINKKSRTLKMVTMEFKHPNEVSYKLEVSSRFYDAFDMRYEIKSKGIEDFVKEDLIRENAEFAIDSISSKNLKNNEKPKFITALIRDKNLSIINDDYV